MPTITVADLQHLIESVSYEHYTRERKKELERPQSGLPQRRSESRTLTRPQSAPKAYSYSHHQRADKLFPFSEPRPPSSRPQSAKSVKSQDDERDLDFTGLSNMMQGLKFKQSKQWKPKSSIKEDIQDTKIKRCFTNEKDYVVNKQKVDPNVLRKSRSSAYSKFRYPLQYHNVKNNNHKLIMEKNIPPSLRRISRYVSSPIRQNCAYNPPVRAVTTVKMHTLSSNSLPSPRRGRIVTSKPPVPPSKQTFVEKDNLLENHEENINEEALERNGSFHYVYNGSHATNPDILVETPQRLYTENEIYMVQQPQDLNANGESPVHIVHQNQGIVVQGLAGVIEDNHSDADTEDYFAEEGAVDANGRGLGDFDDKLSFGDINDLQSFEGISDNDSNRNKPAPTTGDGGNSTSIGFGSDIEERGQRPVTPTPLSNDVSANDIGSDEIESDIEEDIEEQINFKSFSFNNNNNNNNSNRHHAQIH